MLIQRLFIERNASDKFLLQRSVTMSAAAAPCSAVDLEWPWAMYHLPVRDWLIELKNSPPEQPLTRNKTKQSKATQTKQTRLPRFSLFTFYFLLFTSIQLAFLLLCFQFLMKSRACVLMKKNKILISSQTFPSASKIVKLWKIRTSEFLLIRSKRTWSWERKLCALLASSAALSSGTTLAKKKST